MAGQYGLDGVPYGIGKRVELKYTRAMISAALDGSLEAANENNYLVHSVFSVLQPRACTHVPTALLSPRKIWKNDTGFYKTAYKLFQSFVDNFKQFEANTNTEIMSGAPNLRP